MRDVCIRSHSRGVEKKTCSGCTWQVKLTGFVAGNDVGHERKNWAEDNSKIVDLSNWVNMSFPGMGKEIKA